VDLHRRNALVDQGYSLKELRRLRRGGTLDAIRRGTYVHGPLPPDGLERHELRIRAAVEELSSQAVVSHVSAAVLHRLPIWKLPLDRVQVTRPGRCRGGRRGDLVHVHTNTLDPAEIIDLDGLPVTSVERTVLDIARASAFMQAVVVADGAFAREETDLERAWGLLAAMRRWPGVPSARRVLEFADGRSGGVGESRSRVLIAAAGLPAPELQWPVPGTPYETDFAWPERRTVGEFDGRIKYGRLVKPGQDPGDAVFEEKRREDVIRDRDVGVVRWTWSELDAFAPVAHRLRLRLARG
jgi:hypothetical protein